MQQHDRFFADLTCDQLLWLKNKLDWEIEHKFDGQANEDVDNILRKICKHKNGSFPASRMEVLRDIAEKARSYKGTSRPYQKVVYAMFKIFQESGQEYVWKRDIHTIFSMAGLAVDNVPRVLRNAVKHKYIRVAAKDPDYYQLTDFGKEATQNDFKIIPKNKPQPREPVHQTSVRSSVRDLLVKESFVGLPRFSILTTNTQRLLWILAYVKESGLSPLHTQELLYLSRAFKYEVVSKNLGSTLGRVIEAGYVLKDEAHYQITPAGTYYLRSLVNKAS